MAELGDTAKLDIANKLSLGNLSSNSDRNYFEEAYPWLPTVRLEEVFTESVPYAANPAAADAAVAANPTIIQKNTLYTLDEVPLSNGQGWAAFSTPGDTNSTRLINWLNPQLFGPGYFFSLFEFDNTPINLTDGRFQVDSKNGLIRFDDGFTPTDLGLAMPLKLTFYRYIGTTAASGGFGGTGPTGATGSPGSVDFVEEMIQAEDISITDGDTILADTLSIGTTDLESVSLYLNKLYQVQGEDYELTGTGNQSIRWLVGTGTAVPMSSDDVIVVKYAIGGNEVPIIPYQEELTPENIVGADVSLTDTLSVPVDNPATVKIYLNKLFQVQGPGRDYQITGTDNNTILWLAGTGTAVDMSASDELVVVYGTTSDAAILGPTGPTGPQGPGNTTFYQEFIVLGASEVPITIDTILSDQLDNQPDPDSVMLFLNRLLQIPGQDYELSGGTNQQINWLAGTGTGADLDSMDTIYVVYAAV